MGFQNWTPRFREEFIARRGYDPLKYLPAMTGRYVGSAELSDRFLWDVRRTIADLQADNYAAKMAETAHALGLRLSAEAYANGPFDTLLYASRVDVPMSEFWLEPYEEYKFHWSKCMASRRMCMENRSWRPRRSLRGRTARRGETTLIRLKCLAIWR